MVRGAFFIPESHNMPRVTEDHDPRDDEIPGSTAAPNGANWGLPMHSARSLPVVPEDDNETPADRVFALLEGVRDEERATVKLFRVTGPNRYEWCADYPAQEFEEGGFGMVRDTWGPGEYEIRLYAISPESGKFVVRAKPRISIAPDPRATRNPAPVAAPAMSPELAAMLKGMQETQAAMMQALTQRPDPLSQMQNIIGVMAAMRQAMGPVGEAAPRSQISEIVGAIKELRAASDEINPKSSDDDKEPSLMQMLPGVLGIVERALPPRGAPQIPAPNFNAAPSEFPPVVLPETFGAPMPNPAPAGVSSPVPQHAPQPEPGEDDMNPLAILQLRGYLKTMVMLAEQNRPPQEGAKLIYEKLPDAMIDLMELETWFDLLSQVAPETKPHQAWLTQARNLALKMFEEEPPQG